MCGNLYEVLRVEQTATLEEIKLAFKRRALQVHPDKGGNKEAFHLIYQALETLVDPVARKKYDHDMAKPMAESRTKRRRGRKPKANRKERAAGAKAAPETAQSKQTKLLIQIRDCLKQLPRDVRNNVFTKQFSQKQRLILEAWMVEQSPGCEPMTSMTPARTCSAQHQPLPAMTRQHHTNLNLDDQSCNTLAVAHHTAPSTSTRPKQRERQVTRAQGRVLSIGQGKRYRVDIYFDALHIYSSCTDFQTALEYLMVLTFVKQRMRDRTNKSTTFEEKFHETLLSCAREHRINIADLKLRFSVFQACQFFLGRQLKVRTPMVSKIEELGKMRRFLEPFRQYSRNIGSRSLFWLYTPTHLQDAWGRLQKSLADAWAIAGIDSTKFMQRIQDHYDASAHFRGRQLLRWERQHMGAEDKNKYRPKRFRKRKEMSMNDQARRSQASKDAEDPVSKQLSALKVFLARWQRMLEIQRKKDQRERRRLAVLKRKRVQEGQRLKREMHRKRVRSDFMDDLRWI